MRKLITIVLCLFVALPCAVSCKKSEEDVDVAARYSNTVFHYINERTGVTCELHLFSSGRMEIEYRCNGRGKSSYGRYYIEGRIVQFYNHLLTIPADISYSGQEEQYTLSEGWIDGRFLLVTYKEKIGDGDWSNKQTIQFYF